MPYPSQPADRDLLFGLLALQMGLATSDQLIGAMKAWLSERQTALGYILSHRGVLDDDDRADIDKLVGKHLKRHGGDPRASIAALTIGPEDLGPIAELCDADGRTLTLRPGARAAPGPAADATGQRYQLLRPHARGGLGEVHVARDAELGREVALKVIQDRFADDPASRARFLREAQITGHLEHPGIVPVYGLD